MSLLRQKDVLTSFWHDNDIIITPCVCWDGGAWGTHRWYFKSNKPVNCQLIIIICTFFLEWIKSCSFSSGNLCFQLLINPNNLLFRCLQQQNQREQNRCITMRRPSGMFKHASLLAWSLYINSYWPSNRDIQENIHLGRSWLLDSYTTLTPY